MFVYWSTVIFLKLKFLCKKGFFVFALCFRFVFSLCVFALCFRFVFSFCVFALCFRFVFSFCVFVLCFRFLFSLSVFVLKTPISLGPTYKMMLILLLPAHFCHLKSS